MVPRHLLGLGIAASLPAGPFALAAPPVATLSTSALREAAAGLLPSLESLYVDLHRSPELSEMEVETSARLAAELRAVGLEVTERVGGYGVVALLRSGEGKTILVRADMDGLPVLEETDLPHRSVVLRRDAAGKEVPAMHACGHDVHMSVLVGTARLLASMKDRWRGTVVFLAQPAEEVGRGARAMLKDGLFQRFPVPEAAIALHVNAALPAGALGLTEGYALANVDSVDVTIRGIGGHGAWPHATKDPIVLAAQAVLAFQTIVSRETEPGEGVVVTVGSIHGGTKHNVIANEVQLQLTVRTYADAVRQRTLASIRRIVHGLAEAAGVPESLAPVVSIPDDYTPSLYNDPTLTRRLGERFRSVFGEEAVVPVKPVMGGEDFSEYGRTGEKVPVCMVWLGAQAPGALEAARRSGEPPPSLHSSRFQPLAGPTLLTGVEAMSAAALDLLGTSVEPGPR